VVLYLKSVKNCNYTII